MKNFLEVEGLGLEAADEGITMNQFVAQAINEKLERKVL